MKFWTIVVMCTLGAVAYGIVHDQITIRICPEYFTVFHPQIPLAAPREEMSLTALALLWGVLATFWAGFIAGLVLGTAARWGRRPKIAPRALVRSLLICLGIMAVSAVAFGITGFLMMRDDPWLLPTNVGSIPPARHAAFIADLFAHNASYTVGALCTLFLAVRTWLVRAGLPQQDGQTSA